ncbi:MAG TPA: winged helix-turn-helix transcriptional regulator [Labilithrix sp.]|jgi:DNA-binding HxlR family transcriptional regulator|nr:winged helix-turn-helix transcriptional regulator [Labilithrix sp.]
MTKPSDATGARWYHDACGAAHALELLGERWALLVVRELMFGARRFSELREALPRISANVLTQRLEGLETARIVARRQLPSPANAQVYELTPWGYEAEPIFQVLGRWAARSPSHDPTLPLSAVSLMLSFRTMLDAKRARGIDATIGLRLESDTFVVRVRDGEIAIRRAELDGVDVTLSGSPTAIASVVYGGRSLSDAQADGAVTVEGDRALARSFVRLFRLPPKAA